MVQDFILSYAKLIVQYPEILKIEEESITEEYNEILLYAHKDDVGKLIGKEGRMINAIKTVISGCKAKGGKNYRVNVRAID